MAALYWGGRCCFTTDLQYQGLYRGSTPALWRAISRNDPPRRKRAHSSFCSSGRSLRHRTTADPLISAEAMQLPIEATNVSATGRGITHVDSLGHSRVRRRRQQAASNGTSRSLASLVRASEVSAVYLRRRAVEASRDRANRGRRSLHTAEATGSKPVTPTSHRRRSYRLSSRLIAAGEIRCGSAGPRWGRGSRGQVDDRAFLNCASRVKKTSSGSHKS